MAQAPHPRMHGITHLTGGADPIPGLLPPSGTVEQVILATMPGAYYKVPETSGPWLDSSGAGRDAAYTNPTLVGGTAPTRGAPALLDEGDGILCVTVHGPDPAPVLSDTSVGRVTDAFFDFDGHSPFTVSVLVR